MLAQKTPLSLNNNNSGSSDLMVGGGNGGDPISMTIYFNCCKKESMTPNHGFKGLLKRIRNTSFFVENAAAALDVGGGAIGGGGAKLVYKVGLIKDDRITLDRLKEARLVIFGCPQEPFSTAEFQALKDYVDQGGSLLFLSNEGGEVNHNTNINYLLEEYGIMINTDAVTRTVYYKSYFHPKEALISNGITNREILRLAGKKIDEESLSMKSSAAEPIPGTTGNLSEAVKTGLTFLYPYGATLNVQKPGIVILSSGSISYPLQRPVAAAYQGSASSKYGGGMIRGGGKVMVLGSCEMFGDNYFDREENSLLWDSLLKYLTISGTILNAVDAEDPEIADNVFLPDTKEFAQKLKSCLLEPEEFPSSLNQAFDSSLFSFDMSHYGKVISLYRQLRLKSGPLTLIEPQLETPLPPFELATYPPSFRGLDPPSLELFDLDVEFMSREEQLAQICNKCTDIDLDYFIRQASGILDIKSSNSHSDSAVDLLFSCVSQLVKWKKTNL